MPIRESSKVLECGFFLYYGKRRQKGLTFSQRWRVRGVIRQEGSALKLSQPPKPASRDTFFQNTDMLPMVDFHVTAANYPFLPMSTIIFN